MHAFRRAVEAGDVEAALRLPADDIVFPGRPIGRHLG